MQIIAALCMKSQSPQQHCNSLGIAFVTIPLTCSLNASHARNNAVIIVDNDKCCHWYVFTMPFIIIICTVQNWPYIATACNHVCVQQSWNADDLLCWLTCIELEATLTFSKKQCPNQSCMQLHRKWGYTHNASAEFNSQQDYYNYYKECLHTTEH